MNLQSWVRHEHCELGESLVSQNIWKLIWPSLKKITFRTLNSTKTLPNRNCHRVHLLLHLHQLRHSWPQYCSCMIPNFPCIVDKGVREKRNLLKFEEKLIFIPVHKRTEFATCLHMTMEISMRINKRRFILLSLCMARTFFQLWVFLFFWCLCCWLDCQSNFLWSSVIL